ncbi:MAG: bifunctional oligoribonuclease/PAP phosphatase NrnA [Candidatus Paceibacterota bacterium]
MQDIIDFIRESENILILSHKNPDGDALGSSLGLAMALESIGKKVGSFSVNDIPEVFNFLPGLGIFKKDVEFVSYDLVILLDCAVFARTGVDNIYGQIASFDRLLIMDHHPKLEIENFENIRFWIDDKKSATAVMIYELLKEMDIEIDKEIATCLLTGIFTDTGGFQHNNTDETSLQAAAELMKKGPRIDKIAKHIFNSKNVPAIKLWGTALSRIETDPETGMAASYISMSDIKEAGAKQEDLAGLVSVINTVSDAKFSLLLTEYDDQKIKGSLRSEEYSNIDVSKIARSLGGGGHKLASGFEVEGDLNKSVARITGLVLSLKEKESIIN